jgi:transposase
MVQDYIARNRHRLQVYRFPAYAPELNPDEYVWTQSKACLANDAPDDIEDLNDDLRAALARIGNSQSLLRACLRQSALFF